MTREEFESQPGTWWHGTQSGIIGHQGGSFHVGTRHAAVEALSARIGKQAVPQTQQGQVIRSHPSAELYGGHITAPMVNTPRLSSSRGPGSRWEVAAGIPRGEMADWPRMSRHEPMSDVRANAVESGLRKKGQQMRRGIYYVNASEGSQEDVPVSAIVPHRQGFKTHEDYVIEARAQGKRIPEHVIQQYPKLGQGKLF
jgi:hypothetical protein